MTMKLKIAITLDPDVLKFLDSQAEDNRSDYINSILKNKQEELLRLQTITALQEDASDPEYLAELKAWDTVAGDGFNAEG